MQHYYWTDWYSGWGWFLWFGLIFVMFSSFGNWGYTYSAHRRFKGQAPKNAHDFLNERYARGEIKHEDYLKMRSHINENGVSASPNKDLQNRTAESVKLDRPATT